MGFVGKTVTVTRGRWKLEQLGPIDACTLSVDLARVLGDGLRGVLRQVLAFLGQGAEGDERPFERAQRVLGLLDADPSALLGSIMDRPWSALVEDVDHVGEALVDLLRPLSPAQLRRFAEILLVRVDGRKGGLFVSPTAGADPTVPVGSLDDLDALLGDNPLEFFRLLAWGLELNLRPLIAALGTARSSGSRSRATDSSAPTPTEPGRSTS